MKQFFLITTALLFALNSSAQVMNPGFEMQDLATGNPSNWQPRNVILVADSTCVVLGADSINRVTADAHSGNYAIEIRNEFVCGTIYSGLMKQVRYNIDTFAERRVVFTQRPTAFTFYYKLLPILDDGGRVRITLESESGSIIASADTTIYQASGSYRLVTVPLNYNNTNIPEYINMSFWLHNNATLHYGSRFLIDDINQVSTGIGQISKNDGIKVYPIPAKDVLNILIEDLPQNTPTQIKITDAAGRLIRAENLLFQTGKKQVNIRELEQGIYFMSVTSGNKKWSARFIK